MDHLGYRHGLRVPSDDGKRNTPVALTAATSTERTAANCTRGNQYALTPGTRTTACARHSAKRCTMCPTNTGGGKQNPYAGTAVPGKTARFFSENVYAGGTQ